MTRYHTIDQIKSANLRAGNHWFEPATLRFFKSRVGDCVYADALFVTSECCWGKAREYTVRVAYPDGSIETASKLCEFSDSRQAKTAIRRALEPYATHEDKCAAVQSAIGLDLFARWFIYS